MNQILTYDTSFYSYAVHYIDNNGWLQFDVYPITRYVDSERFDYIDKENEPDELENFDGTKALKKIEGSFVWRGVWESRLYFVDTEYWGEEMTAMYELFTKHITPFCKTYLQSLEPEYKYED